MNILQSEHLEILIVLSECKIRFMLVGEANLNSKINLKYEK